MAYPFESSIHLTNVACKLLFASTNSSIEEDASGFIQITAESTNVMTLKSSGMALTSGAFVNDIETTLTNDDTHLPTSGAVYDAIDAISAVEWGTATNQYIVLGSATGDVQSDSSLSYSISSKVLTIDGGASDGGEIKLEYNNVATWQVRASSATASIQSWHTSFSLTSFTDGAFMGIGSTSASDAFVTVKDPSTTTKTYILRLRARDDSSFFDFRENGSAYFTGLGSDDAEDHVMAIDDSTGLITKRSVASIVAGAGSSDVSVTNQADNRIVTATGTTDELNAEANLKFDGTDLSIAATGKIYLDGGTDTYIVESAGNTISFFANSGEELQINSTGVIVKSNTTSNTYSGLVIEQISDDAYGATIQWHKERITASTANDGDTVGAIKGYFDNDNATPQTLTGGRLELIVDDASDGTEDTHWSFWQMVDGVQTEFALGTDFGGAGAAWGTATNKYLTFGSASGAIESNTDLSTDGAGNLIAHSSFQANLNGLLVDRASYEYGRIQMYFTSIKRTDLDGGTADGASAVAYNFDTKNNLSTAGSKVLRVATLSSERFVVYGSGAMLLGTYGSGTHTGTATYTLQVDSSGNLIEGSASIGDVSWGTASNNYIVFGSSGGDIQSVSYMSYNTSSYVMSLDGTGGFGGSTAYKYGGAIGLTIKGKTGTSGEINSPATISIISTHATTPHISLGDLTTSESYVAIRDVSNTADSTLQVYNISSDKTFDVREDGSLYIPELGDDDTEDHLVAIDDTTGLLTKRSVASISGGSSPWQVAANVITTVTAGDDLRLATNEQIQFVSANDYISGGTAYIDVYNGGSIAWRFAGGGTHTTYTSILPDADDDSQLGDNSNAWSRVVTHILNLESTSSGIALNSGDMEFTDSTNGTVALSTLVAGSPPAYGTSGQVPYMNGAGTAFLYSANLVFSGTDLTITGGATSLALKAGASDDHVYMSFFADSAAQSTRSGYFGFSVAAQDNLKLVNEMSGGDIFLQTTSGLIREVSDVVGGSSTAASILTYADYTHQITQTNNDRFPAYVLLGDPNTSGSTVGEIAFCSDDSTETYKRIGLIRATQGASVTQGNLAFYTWEGASTIHKFELNRLGHLAINGTASTTTDHCMVWHRDGGTTIIAELGRVATWIYGASGLLTATEGMIFRPNSYQSNDYAGFYVWSNIHAGVQHRRGTTVSDLRVGYGQMYWYQGSTTTMTLRHSWSTLAYYIYGSSTAAIYVDGATSTTSIYMQSNTGSDSRIYFRENTSTRFIIGYDVSLTAFQIHSSTSFSSSLASSDFAVTTAGRIYMGNLLNQDASTYLKHNTSTGQVTYNTSSDLRLKENIEEYQPDSLGWIVNQRLIKFDRKNGTCYGEIGWDGTQMSEIMPSLTFKDKKGYWNIKETKFPVHFHRAIQQLYAIDQGHDDRIGKLEKKVRTLRKEVTALKKQLNL